MGKQVHLPATDLTRWRLHSHEGDHEWHYLNAAEASDGSTRPQTFAERYLLGLTSPSTPPPKSTSSPTHNDTTKSPFTTPALAGFHFLTHLQLPEGHWACDYGGPSFLLPGLVFAMYITRTPIPEPWRIEMTRYLASRVNPDGGWGLHHEGRSTVFATGLYYVMLRLLGMGKGEPLVVKARECLLGLGE
jgi:lanosterol synthase